MNARKMASCLAALTMTGTMVVGGGSVAMAQTGPGNSQGANCQNAYAPNGQGRGLSDSTPQREQNVRAASGCRYSAPGRRWNAGVESTYQKLGEVTANANGELIFDFSVPTNLADGRHDFIFTAQDNGEELRLPFTVQGGRFTGTSAPGQSGAPGNSGAAPGRQNARVAGVLPRTGTDALVPLSVGGIVLVAAGAGMVVAARRRREGMPSNVA